MHKLRFRQIHLDFHTSEHIPDVADDFDPEEFAKTLYEAHVDSVTCFARCHHGYLYYESKKFPELIHPNLRTPNLLKQQIEACHKYDIKVPIYTTVQWDYLTAKQHPEWLVLDENGAPMRTKTFDAGFYRNICLNTPYRDFIKEQTKDIFDVLGHVDGLFFDILNLKPCACPRCVDAMKDAGLDPTDEAVRYEYAQTVMDDFKRDISEFVRNLQPECPIFYNAGHIGVRHRNALDTFSHLEIESLPGDFWGYMHFPITALYARNLGLDFMGMTGKFHTSWGDFSSFKTQAALEYECFRSLSFTGKCSIGDQLIPNGKISEPAYDLVGKVYGQVKSKEPWCVNVKPVVEVGIFAPEEFRVAGSPIATKELIGAVRLFMELGIQCDVIDTYSDLSSYRLLVLPDNIPVNKALEQKLKDYVQKGGKLIASYESGMSEENTFIDILGISYIGEAPFSPDFIVAEGALGKDLYNTEYVMYKKGLHIETLDSTEELLKTNKPYFNRSWEHFCSHRHTPSSEEYCYPAVAANKNSIYFSHPVFSTYEEFGPRWIKTFINNAIDLLMPDRLIRHNGPSSMDIQLNIQKEKNRYVLHILHYIPERRTSTIDIIEDIIPLYNIEIELTLGEKICDIFLVPSNEKITHKQVENKVVLTIPKINGHEMLEINY